MYKPYIYKTSAILILWLVLIQCGSSRAQSNMQAIQFIPKAFHDVKLGFDENTIHALTPHYPETDDVIINEIVINSPKKIIVDIKKDNYELIIPLCGYVDITRRRGLKFADYDEVLGEYAACNAIFIHIKKTDEEEWFSGKVIDDDENVFLDDDERDAEERQERIKEAQKYTLEELDSGSAGPFNINALKYVNIPLISGFYEVYVSLSGLESNHMQVEIVFEK